MQFNDYNHIMPIQVRFNDIDRLNHVNNACYLNYFELGRIKYFNDVSRQTINWNEKGFVLARTELDYLEPVFLNDEIFCCTKVIKTGTKSLTIRNSIVKNTAGTLTECATGITILVAMDYILQQSIKLPLQWVELIRDFEK